MAKINSKGCPAPAGPAGSAVSEETFRLHLLSGLFLAVAVFAAYANSLHGTWALDDTSIRQYTSIEENLNLRLGYRKIAYLTFQFNKWINPGDPVNYRLFNIAVHLVNTLLVYWLAFLTLRLPELRDRFARYSYPVALLTASVFALHPININAVAYIVQRMTSLSALFVLMGLISYVYARIRPFGPYSVPLYLCSAACILLGIFSKENAVMALPLIILYDIYFISGYDRRLLLRVTIGASVILSVVAVAAVSLDFFKTISAVGGQFLNINKPIQWSGWTAADVYWTPMQHILTEFRVLCRYLSLFVLPLPGRLVFDYWGFIPSTGLIEPPATLASILFIAGLASVALLKKRDLPLLSFGILWYLIAISLESFVAVGSDFYFEHRNYLPSAGLLFGLIGQAAVSLEAQFHDRKVLWGVVLGVSLLLGGLTFQRNLVWKDSVTLWTDTVDKAPGNIRALMALGNASLKSADFTSAGSYYEKALSAASSEKRPQYFHDAAYSLGMVSLFRGDLPAAKKIIGLMEERLAGESSTGILRGFYFSLSGDTKAALQQLNSSLRAATGLDRVIVYTLLGDTYRKLGQTAEAISSYQAAVDLDPSFAAAYYGLGNVYFITKDVAHAEKYTDAALDLDPGNPLALAQMADIVLVKKGPARIAKEYAEKAVASSPPFYQPYASMATVLVVTGDDAGADAFFVKAREHGLRGYEFPLAKARAYFMKGDRKKAFVYLKEVAGMADAPAGLKTMIRNSPE